MRASTIQDQRIQDRSGSCALSARTARYRGNILTERVRPETSLAHRGKLLDDVMDDEPCNQGLVGKVFHGAHPRAGG